MNAADDTKQSPLVSIMMPARNVAPVITDTIASIKQQTYPHWELVFVDDGSTDDTVAVVSALAQQDPRIKIYPLPHGGRGRARNACIERMTGEFVAVCDADDISFPERFEKQVHYLRNHPEIGAVGSHWIPFAGAKPDPCGPIRKFPTSSPELRRAFSRQKMRFHNATVMLRRSLYAEHGGYNVELRRAQDYEFFSRLSRRGVYFSGLDEPLLYYRQESSIPSIAYFLENGMYMAYADRLLAGKVGSFAVFDRSVAGNFWRIYYRAKYVYFYFKMLALRAA
ncbi:MAG: glycosyltransferase family 2 protein [Burkholderiales bacterium]|nr:glycosyltransferase family 2 protein [Burkholderiales bacterium]